MSRPPLDFSQRLIAELRNLLPKSWRRALGMERSRNRPPSNPSRPPGTPAPSADVSASGHLRILPPKRELPSPPKECPLRENSRVLVTGGAGFIGSALIQALNASGVEQIVVTDFLGSDNKWRNLTPLKFEDVVPADHFVTSIGKHADHFGKFSTVFHLGACSATTETDAGYLLENNYGHTKALCQWALEAKSRFVYASSAATYGDGTQGMRDQDVDLHQLRPLNMYGYSKHLFDLWAEREGILDRIVGLKYFNVFGPNEYHKAEMRSLVCKAYEQIISTGKIKLFKSYKPEYRDGEQMRDFVYVKDAVAMTLHLASSPLASGLYNIGTGKPRTWLDLAKAIFVALDRKPEIEFIEMPENIRNQYQYHTAADTSKLRATEYTAPCMELEDSIRDYVKNYLVTDARLGDSAAAPAPK